jgi:uncharacterized membrane protein HdeD (DUF308 family)
MYRGEMFILKGTLGIIFGIMTIVFPNFTLGTFFTIFGLFIIAAGIIAFLFAVTSQHSDTSFWFWLSLGILALGILSVFIPEIVALAFALVIAGWALVTGISDLKRCITGSRYYYSLFAAMLGSGLLLLVGMFYLIPALREHYLMTIFGVFALVFGIFSFALGEMILRGKLPCDLMPSLRP